MIRLTVCLLLAVAIAIAKCFVKSCVTDQSRECCNKAYVNQSYLTCDYSNEELLVAYIVVQDSIEEYVPLLMDSGCSAASLQPRR